MTQAATLVRDVLGRELPILRTYPDGSFDCPFCHAAVTAPAERCANPWCPASADALADPRCAPRFRAQVEASDLAAADAAQRRADHAAAMRRLDEARTERAAAHAVVVAEAERRGACVVCATADPYRVRYIRHRQTCPARRR